MRCTKAMTSPAKHPAKQVSYFVLFSPLRDGLWSSCSGQGPFAPVGVRVTLPGQYRRMRSGKSTRALTAAGSSLTSAPPLALHGQRSARIDRIESQRLDRAEPIKSSSPLWETETQPHISQKGPASRSG